MSLVSSRGAAISTTADDHRLGLLRLSAEHWRLALPLGAPLFVTVDGDEDACRRAVAAVRDLATTVVRVGQPGPGWDGGPFGMRAGRLGVAANKNTGIELLMDWCPDQTVGTPYPSVEHLFLSDDDTWPRGGDALDEHVLLSHEGERVPHSMVCWGSHRRSRVVGDLAAWGWPRGSMLYVHRDAIVRVGGMDERFGPGGHEHVEWSRRIHQATMTPTPFPSPVSYAEHRAMGAARLWHCEDMARPGEPFGNLRARRRKLTSIRRADGDWEHIEKIMAEKDGQPGFVPFRAAGNGRLSATMTASRA